MLDPITQKELFNALSNRDLEHVLVSFKHREKFNDYQLCFVDQESSNSNLYLLYFVKDFTKAYGDDWNDVPYEHNASEPYNDDVLTLVVYNKECDYYSPCTGHLNSPYSVDYINENRIPWLTSSVDDYALYPGTTVEEAIRLATKQGSDVYVQYSELV